MLQVLEPLHIRRVEPAVLRLPFVVGRRADAVVPPHFIDRATGIGLFQNRVVLPEIKPPGLMVGLGIKPGFDSPRPDAGARGCTTRSSLE